jgi:hypothetical protein
MHIFKFIIAYTVTTLLHHRAISARTYLSVPSHKLVNPSKFLPKFITITKGGLLPKRSKYKCAGQSSLFSQRKIENAKFKTYSKRQRESIKKKIF